MPYKKLTCDSPARKGEGAQRRTLLMSVAINHGGDTFGIGLRCASAATVAVPIGPSSS